MTHPHVLKEQGGIPLPLLIPIGSPEPTNERWFHGQMSRKEAEYLILEKGRPGSYLVRESQSDPGNYVLTVNVDDKVAEIKIRFNVSVKINNFCVYLVIIIKIKKKMILISRNIKEN